MFCRVFFFLISRRTLISPFLGLLHGIYFCLFFFNRIVVNFFSIFLLSITYSKDSPSLFIDFLNVSFVEPCLFFVGLTELNFILVRSYLQGGNAEDA